MESSRLIATFMSLLWHEAVFVSSYQLGLSLIRSLPRLELYISAHWQFLVDIESDEKP